jgi:hypothetical protein
MNWNPEQMAVHTPWPVCLVVWTVELPLIFFSLIFYLVTMEPTLHMVEAITGYDEKASWKSRLPKSLLVAAATLVFQTIGFVTLTTLIVNEVVDGVTPAWFKRLHWWNK